MRQVPVFRLERPSLTPLAEPFKPSNLPAKPVNHERLRDLLGQLRSK